MKANGYWQGCRQDAGARLLKTQPHFHQRLCQCHFLWIYLSLGPIIYLCLSEFLWSLPRRLHHAGVDSPWSRAFSTCWLSKLSICDLQPLLGPQKNFSPKYPSRIVSGCVHDQLTKFWGSHFVLLWQNHLLQVVRIDREFWHDPESHLLLNRTMRLMCTRCW